MLELQTDRERAYAENVDLADVLDTLQAQKDRALADEMKRDLIQAGAQEIGVAESPSADS